MPETDSEQKTFCPNCLEKGTVSPGTLTARCPTCGERFDPRDYGPDDYDDVAGGTADQSATDVEQSGASE